jgi:hypothetical protein
MERNPAVAVVISKGNPGKPMKGQFWRGGESKDKGCTTTLGETSGEEALQEGEEVKGRRDAK